MKARLAAACTLALALAGCARLVPPPVDIPETRPGYIEGYLRGDERPNPLAWLPPPPAAGSSAFAADAELYGRAVRLEGSERWKLAASDADLSFPHAAGVFECALGMPISRAATPHLQMLLRRVLVDAIRACDGPKEKYRRPRPFMVMHAHTCTPQHEASLEAQSYPSGHASVGWAWALTLAELAPDRADAILARGYDFGTSRVICRAHWKSDVEAGRLVGAATLSRLHDDAVFDAQMQEARREIAAARAVNAKAPRDCAAEAAALAERPESP